MIYTAGYLVAVETGEVFVATATGMQIEKFGFSRVTVTSNGGKDHTDIDLWPFAIDSNERALEEAKHAAMSLAGDTSPILVHFAIETKGSKQ